MIIGSVGFPGKIYRRTLNAVRVEESWKYWKLQGKKNDQREIGLNNDFKEKKLIISVLVH